MAAYQPLDSDRIAALDRGNTPRSNAEAAYSFVNACTSGWIHGRTRNNVWQQGNVLYSYGTAIAARLDDGGPVYVTEEHYSPSTSKHVGHVHTQLRAAGYQPIPGYVECSPAGTMGGWQRSEHTPYTVHVRTADTLPEIIPAWTSDNGKWHIWPVVCGDGGPWRWAIGWHAGCAVAYASADSSTLFRVYSGTIPAYVLRALAALDY